MFPYFCAHIFRTRLQLDLLLISVILYLKNFIELASNKDTYLIILCNKK